MPLKQSGAGELTVVDRFERGVGWIAHPDETMRRASHAVESDGGLWIIDPVDAAGLDDLLAEYADPEGVVVLLDRHKRDAAAVANRHDVAVYVPEWMDGVAGDIDAPTRRFGRELAGFDVGDSSTIRCGRRRRFSTARRSSSRSHSGPSSTSGHPARTSASTRCSAFSRRRTFGGTTPTGCSWATARGFSRTSGRHPAGGRRQQKAGGPAVPQERPRVRGASMTVAGGAGHEPVRPAPVGT